MNITGISLNVPAVSDNSLVNGASNAMLAKSLDTNEELGNDMVRMMERSVQPNLGSNVDIMV